MPSARCCLFCDSHDLNREHIWPEWVVKLFPEKTGYTATATNSETGGRSWQVESITHKARFVRAVQPRLDE